jgi:hypothetical protein
VRCHIQLLQEEDATKQFENAEDEDEDEKDPFAIPEVTHRSACS